MKLNAQELRTVPEDEAQAHLASLKRRPLYFILENIYDTYNIGGLFRLADALAVSKIYICGQSEIPPNPKIKKASIGTYKIVPWEYRKTAKEAIDELRSIYCHSRERGNPEENHNIENTRLDTTPLPAGRQVRGDDTNKVQIVAVEQDKRSKPYTQVSFHCPLALLVGNETYGILPETLGLVDEIAEIPMWGINKSLNVIVSLAIVAYQAMRGR